MGPAGSLRPTAKSSLLPCGLKQTSARAVVDIPRGLCLGRRFGRLSPRGHGQKQAEGGQSQATSFHGRRLLLRKAAYFVEKTEGREAGHAIEVHHAVEMIAFMLDDARVESPGRD